MWQWWNYAKGGHQEVALWIGMYRMRFIVAGDFNTSDVEMEVSPWLQRVHGRLVRPRDVQKTCFQGKGSLIDYAIVSQGAEGLIKDLEAQQQRVSDQDVARHMKRCSAAA